MYTNIKKYLAWLILLFCMVYCLFEVDGKGDFYIFISAAADLSSNIDIYTKTYVDGYHYYYSVLFALLLKPLTFLPFTAVKYCWILLNALLFFNLLRMLYISEPLKRLNVSNRDLFVFLMFIASLRFFMDNIHTSQITILILYCSIKGLTLILKGNNFSGALLLALGINIKLLPLVLLPYLFYRGYFKAIAFTLVIYLASIFLPSMIIGNQYNMHLLGSWLSSINPMNSKHILDVDERSFHSLTTLLSTLLKENVPDMYALPLKRNIADVSLSTLSNIILCIRATLICFTLYFLKFPLFKRTSDIKVAVEVSYILLLIPLIFPHQQHYAFLFAMPAFAVVLYNLISLDKRNTIMIILLAIVYLTFNLKLLLGQYNQYYEHYKIITYAALILIPLLVWTSLKADHFSPGRRLT